MINMFCTNCGKEIPDTAEFCPLCGNQVGITDNDAVLAENRAYEPLSKDSEEGVASNSAAKKKSSKLPIALGAIALAIVAVFALNHFKVNNLGTTPPSSNNRSEKQEGSLTSSDSSSKGSQQGNGGQSGATQDTAASNPKDDIALSPIKLDVDSGGRYVITGKITNNGTMELTPEIVLTATEHSIDKYGEEATKETNSFHLISASSNISCDNNKVTASQLKPKETREFIAYPEYWCDADISYSDVKALVERVTLPASVLKTYNHLFDIDKTFTVNDLSYSSAPDVPGGATRVVSGSVTNNMGSYVSRADVRFIMLDAKGDIVPSRSNTTRPSGAVLRSARVENLKPGATAQFKQIVDEGYSSAKFLDVTYVPDESKNKLMD